MDKKFYLTKNGVLALKQEEEKLKTLKELKLKEGAPAPLYSEELNTEFVAFREDLDYLQGRLEEIEHILNNYQLIKPPSKAKRQEAGLGAELLVAVNDEKQTFKIVGTLEAEPSLGRISNESPVGQAFLGKKAGDEVVLTAPAKIKYKILKIKYV